MSPARAPFQPKASPASEEPDDLFILAYDEAIAALDEVEAADAALERLKQCAPDEARRPPRALIGITTEDGRSVPVYAHTHQEIDEAAEAMRIGSYGDAVTDTPVIDAFVAAAHEALSRDSERIMAAHAVAGLVEAQERCEAAWAEAQAAAPG